MSSTESQEMRVDPSGGSRRGYSGITVRSVVISFVFLIVITVMSQVAGLKEEPWGISTWMMPSAGGLLLVFLALTANLALKKHAKVTPFSPAEMIVGYVVIMVGGYVQSISIVGFSIMNIVEPWYSAFLVNKATYAPGLEKMSSWITIKDMNTALQFWTGSKTGVPWNQWVVPIISWTLFWGILAFLMVCLATLVRRQWTEHERLTYPLVVPVVAVIKGTTDSVFDGAGDKVPLWQNKFLYVGMIYPVFLGLLRLLNSYFPAIPKLSGHFAIAALFKEPPWDALGIWPPVDFWYDYPEVVGVAYLLRLELLFSMVFFYFFAYRFVLVAYSAMGYQNIYPIVPQEVSRGAYLGLTLVLIWNARHELKTIFRKGILGQGDVDDSNEPISYRFAVFGGGISLVLILLFAKYLVGMSLSIIALYFLLFFATVIGYARLRAEAGYPHGQASPLGMYVNVLTGVGQARMSANDAMGMAQIFQTLSDGFAATGMAMALESFSLGDVAKIKRRNITRLILLAVIVAVVVGYVAALPVIYRYGANNLNAYYHYAKAQVWFHYDNPTYHAQYFGSLGLGLVLAVVLGLLRSSFVWWPLAPIGLAIATVDWMRIYWGSFFIAWVIKLVVLRYGGTTLERTLRPAFYGMIVGSVVMSLISSAIQGLVMLLT